MAHQPLAHPHVPAAALPVGHATAAGLVSRWVPAAAAFVATVAPAAANGGYFPTSWGWSALALLWATALALVFARRVRLGALERAFLATLAAAAGWTALSALWSEDGSRAVGDAQRMLVYVAGAAAVLVVVQPRACSRMLGGMLAGITTVAAYAVATRLFPERLGVYDAVAGYRLSEPLGYWNALGIFAVLGLVLALVRAARGETRAGRALAGASVVVLVLAVYFTFSRGAWVALALGLAAAVILSPRRLQVVTTLLALAPAAGLAVWLASQSPALTHDPLVVAEATREGHRLALACLVLAACAGAATFALGAVEGRLRFGRTVRAAYAAVLLLVAVGAVVLVCVRFGTPDALVRDAYASFTAPPPEVDGDLNRRLFSLSANGRVELWSAAWSDYTAHPWLGSGAGSYERYWLEHRPIDLKVRDAHSLYLETLAELGPLGLSLLLACLALPLVAAARARRDPLVAGACGAYVAFLAHAGVDWDWEMPAVTLTALLLGGALLVLARPPDARALSRRLRMGGVAATLALGAAAFVVLIGNSALAASSDAAAAGDWARAEAEARKAALWSPWSPEPWRRIGEARLARGELGAARAAFRAALAEDGGDWSLWLGLARTSDGAARRDALARAARLNPLSAEIAEVRADGPRDLGGL